MNWLSNQECDLVIAAILNLPGMNLTEKPNIIIKQSSDTSRGDYVRFTFTSKSGMFDDHNGMILSKFLHKKEIWMKHELSGPTANPFVCHEVTIKAADVLSVFGLAKASKEEEYHLLLGEAIKIIHASSARNLAKDFLIRARKARQ